MINKIHNEDCIETIQRMEDESINCVVTSPPYWGLRDYGVDGQLGLEKTPEEYVNKLVKIFREIRRVLKKDGTVWLNLGDSYVSAKGRYSSAEQTISGKSRNEPINGNRPDLKNHKFLKDKDLTGIPWRVAFALQADGWYLRQDIIWHKPNPMPESVTDRCSKAHEYVFLLTKSAKYWYDADAIKEPYKYDGRNDTIFKGSAKYEKADMPNLQGGRERWPDRNGANKRSVWTVITQPYSEAHFATFPEALIEPMIVAGCPEQVCIKCGKAKERITETEYHNQSMSKNEKYTQNDFGCNQTYGRGIGETKTTGWTDCGCNAGFESGIIYDPFMGAGTTAKVALRANRKFIGSELNSDYCKLANDRTESLLKQIDLFHEGG